MIIGAIITIVLTTAFVLLNERWGLLSSDHFPTPLHRIGGYAWFAALTMVVSTLVSESAARSKEIDLSTVHFVDLFSFHMILVVFLAGWWLLVDRPPVAEFLNLRGDFGFSALVGVAGGVGGWAITLGVVIALAVVASGFGLTPQHLEPSPMIPWMAGLGLVRKAIIVLVAMTVEEAFFRGWLQKRVGLVASTVLFAAAHASYGQPFLIIGVAVISLVIGTIFYKTRNLIPCMIAHGVFDSIQLFVIVPIALKFIGGS